MPTNPFMPPVPGTPKQATSHGPGSGAPPTAMPRKPLNFVDSGHGNDPFPMGPQPKFRVPPGPGNAPPRAVGGAAPQVSHPNGGPLPLPRFRDSGHGNDPLPLGPRPKLITPPGPPLMPPQVSHPNGGTLPPKGIGIPPVPLSNNPPAFDPNAYGKTLSGTQLQDFNSLRKNMGGNFKNFAGGGSIQDALNKRYGVKMQTISDPPPDLYNLMMQRQMR